LITGSHRKSTTTVTYWGIMWNRVSQHHT